MFLVINFIIQFKLIGSGLSSRADGMAAIVLEREDWDDCVIWEGDGG